MTPDPTRDDLETALQAAFNPYFEIDCIDLKYETDSGGYLLEVGNFEDGLIINCAAFHGGYTRADIDLPDGCELVDEGRGYTAFRPPETDLDGLIDVVREIGEQSGAELVDLNPRNIENLPGWWPEVLKPA